VFFSQFCPTHTQKRPNNTITADNTPISVLSAFFFFALVGLPRVFIGRSAK